MQVKQILFSIVLSSALLGCNELNKVNDSLDQIKSMQADTNSMKNQTKNLSTDSCELYDALRQGDTLTSRRDAITNLLSAQQEGRKISEAGKYFMAFEFQLWSQACQDSDNTKREFLMGSAAMEFLRDVQEFFPDPADLSPNPAATADGVTFSKSNLQASLNAISASIHLLNPKQEYRATEDPTFKTYSMLDILEEGLAAKAKINSGAESMDTVPRHVKEVLLQEKYAVAVLQARYNMAVAVVLNGISPISEGWWPKVSMWLRSWNPDMSRANLEQLEEYQKYVQGALDVRDFLKKNGYAPEMDSTFRHLLRNMKYQPTSSRGELFGSQELKLSKMIEEYAQD